MSVKLALGKRKRKVNRIQDTGQWQGFYAPRHSHYRIWVCKEKITVCW